MSLALVSAVLAASVVGSLHCAGMCGGFVAFYSGAGGPSRGRWLAHAAYSGGRLLTYALLGSAAGAVGAAADLAGSAAGVQRVAAPLAGALIVVWGVWSLLLALDVRLPVGRAPRWLTRAISNAYRGLERRPPLARALLLGLLSTLLPCGWLWKFAVLAAGTGNPWHGALVMTVFWAGTLPVMLGLGMALQLLSAPLRRRLPALTAAVLIVVGAVWLTGHFVMPDHAHGQAAPHHHDGQR